MQKALELRHAVRARAGLIARGEGRSEALRLRRTAAAFFPRRAAGKGLKSKVCRTGR